MRTPERRGDDRDDDVGVVLIIALSIRGEGGIVQVRIMKAFIDGQFKVICDSSVVGMRIKTVAIYRWI